MKFDGTKIKDQIVGDLQKKVQRMPKAPVLAVVLVGDDYASQKYTEVKRKLAQKIGIEFKLAKFPDGVDNNIISLAIKQYNNDENIFGIMIQVPLPEYINRDELIGKIDTKKDVDGLRFCADLDSDYKPPVVLSVLEALRMANVDIENSSIALIGKGFLVGAPLARILKNNNYLRVANSSSTNLAELTRDADVVISATGAAGIIKPNMIKNNVILIDAGTSEVGGRLAGDIDSDCYPKSKFYTPVPGGIGPVTVAMLMSNVVLATANTISN